MIPLDNKSCSLGYVAHSDPGGHLPSWVTNKLSSILAPKMVKRIHKACQNYGAWKVKQNILLQDLRQFLISETS